MELIALPKVADWSLATGLEAVNNMGLRLKKTNIGHSSTTMSGGTSWFDANSPYYGIENIPTYKLLNDATYVSVTYRKPSASTTGKWWLLFVINVSGNQWQIKYGARFTLPAGASGATVTQNFSSADTTFGSATIPATGDYYIAWVSAVTDYIPTGAFWVDATSGGAIDYVSSAVVPVLDGTFTMVNINGGSGIHLYVSEALLYSSSSPVAESSWIAIDQNTLDATTAIVIVENAIAVIQDLSNFGSLKFQYTLNNGAYNGTWLTQTQLNTAIVGQSITNHTNSLRLKAQFNSDGAQPADISGFGAYAQASGVTVGDVNFQLPLEVVDISNEYEVVEI